MIPYGLLHYNWQNEFPLLANYAVDRPQNPIDNYSLVFKTKTTQVVNKFGQDCIHSCDEERAGDNCYVIYSKSPERKGTLQICQGELLNFDTNVSLPLALTYVNSSKQLIVNKSEGTQNESIWTFTKVQPMFTLTALHMHPFQMTITNAKNTRIVAQINRQQQKYPFDAYAYELMVMDDMLYNPHEFGLLLTISLVIEDIRSYPKTADEQY